MLPVAAGRDSMGSIVGHGVRLLHGTTGGASVEGPLVGG
jgi:hypothetical protein